MGAAAVGLDRSQRALPCRVPDMLPPVNETVSHQTGRKIMAAVMAYDVFWDFESKLF